MIIQMFSFQVEPDLKDTEYAFNQQCEGTNSEFSDFSSKNSY